MIPNLPDPYVSHTEPAALIPHRIDRERSVNLIFTRSSAAGETEFSPIADLNEACDLVEQALINASPRVRAAWNAILETLRNEF